MATTPVMKTMRYATAFPILDQQIRPTHCPAVRAARGVARTLSIATALLLPLAVRATDPIDDALEQCLRTPCGGTTAGMTEYTYAAYQAYDRRMNTLYQAMMSKTDPISREAIRNTRRAWLAYRTAQKAADNAPWRADASSVVSPDIEGLNVEAVRTRVTEPEYYPH